MSNNSLYEIEKKNPNIDFGAVKEKFPVSLEKICDALNIYVDLRDDLSKDVSGKIFKENDCYKIHINKSQPSTRVRFTVAHEIGHFIKHRDYIDEHGEILERLNHWTYSKKQIRQEKEANQFAAELLMPEEYFIEKYNILAKKTSNKREEILNNLAEYFWVSTQAVAYRIITLGLDCA
jgi:Zn-dependent peptidase ImmA (M78 family)